MTKGGGRREAGLINQGPSDAIAVEKLDTRRICGTKPVSVHDEFKDASCNQGRKWSITTANKRCTSQQCDQPMHYSVDEREVIHRTKRHQHGVIEGQAVCVC